MREIKQMKKYIAGISVVLILLVLLFTRGLQKMKFTLFNPVSAERAEEVWQS